MPRSARIKDNFGIYYITQYCSASRPLFKDDMDRTKFLEILESIKKKFDIKVYAYCIAHSKEYHLIIDANGSDISKVMKAINIPYAMYINHDSNLFKDRYKSKLLDDHTALMEAIYSIHSRKLTLNEVYNSCCFYNQEALLNIGLLNSEDIKLLKDNSVFNNSKESCSRCITSVDEAIKAVYEYANGNNLPLSSVIKEKELRNKLIVKIRRESTLSLKDIGQVFGGISESTVSKIISNS